MHPPPSLTHLCPLGVGRPWETLGAAACARPLPAWNSFAGWQQPKLFQGRVPSPAACPPSLAACPGCAFPARRRWESGGGRDGGKEATPLPSVAPAMPGLSSPQVARGGRAGRVLPSPPRRDPPGSTAGSINTTFPPFFFFFSSLLLPLPSGAAGLRAAGLRAGRLVGSQPGSSP